MGMPILSTLRYSLCPLPEANVMQQSGMRCGPLAGMAQLARQRNAHGQQAQSAAGDEQDSLFSRLHRQNLPFHRKCIKYRRQLPHGCREADDKLPAGKGASIFFHDLMACSPVQYVRSYYKVKKLGLRLAPLIRQLGSRLDS